MSVCVNESETHSLTHTHTQEKGPFIATGADGPRPPVWLALGRVNRARATCATTWTHTHTQRQGRHYGNEMQIDAAHQEISFFFLRRRRRLESRASSSPHPNLTEFQNKRKKIKNMSAIQWIDWIQSPIIAVCLLIIHILAVWPNRGYMTE